MYCLSSPPGDIDDNQNINEVIINVLSAIERDILKNIEVANVYMPILISVHHAFFCILGIANLFPT